MKKLISFVLCLFVLMNTSIAIHANISNSAHTDQVPDRYGQAVSPYEYKGVNVFMRLNKFYRPDSIISGTPISSHGKSNGYQFNVEFKVTVNVVEKYNQPVSVSSELEMLSKDLTTLEVISKKKNQLNKQINIGKSEVIFDVLEGMNPGQYKLTYHAIVENDQYSSHGDARTIYFTVTNTNVLEGWHEQISPVANATSTLKQEVSEAQCSVNSHKNTKRSIDGDVVINPHDQSMTAILTGSWTSMYRDGNMMPVKKAKVEVWYQDCNSTWNKVATTQTDVDGKFVAKYRVIENAAVKWKIEVYLENEFSVITNMSDVYKSVYVSLHDLTYGGNVGPLTITTGSATESATWAFHDAYRIYDFMSKVKKPDFKSVIRFVPHEQSLSYYDTSVDIVNILGDDIRSGNIILHELGHMYMYHSYNHWLPASDCSTGRHVYFGTTEPGCAWTEGWAHFISLAVNGDNVFRATNYSWNAEHTSEYDHHGDQVEGRVAGALWDLYDQANDGLDERNVPFADIYHAALSDRVNNFSGFWELWKEQGGKLGPKYSIHQNEIMYDEDVILRVGESQVAEGDRLITYLLPGNEQLLEIVTSEHRMKLQIEVDVYEDIDREHLLFSSKKQTNGYGKTDPYLFQIGRNYYVFIRDNNPDHIVFANVQVNTVSDSLAKERDPR